MRWVCGEEEDTWGRGTLPHRRARSILPLPCSPVQGDDATGRPTGSHGNLFHAGSNAAHVHKRNTHQLMLVIVDSNQAF